MHKLSKLRVSFIIIFALLLVLNDYFFIKHYHQHSTSIEDNNQQNIDQKVFYKNFPILMQDVEANLKVINSISLTNIQGLVEVVYNNNKIVYVSMDGKTAIWGDLYNNNNSSNDNNHYINSSQTLIRQLNINGLKAIPSNHYLTYLYNITNKTPNTLYLFSSPTCPGCAKVEQYLYNNKDNIHNLQVNVLITPFLGPLAEQQAKDIWCSDGDKNELYSHLMFNRLPDHLTKEKLSQCDVSILQDNISYATSHNIYATPTAFTEKGKRLDGDKEIITYIEQVNIELPLPKGRGFLYGGSFLHHCENAFCQLID